MSIGRREFLQVLAVASAGGMALGQKEVLAGDMAAAQKLYELPAFGNVSFMHFTDCHAQLNPIYFREPSVNLGVSEAIVHCAGHTWGNGHRPDTLPTASANHDSR